MTLEEHRIQLLKRITESAGPQVARDLVAEGHTMLVCCQLQTGTLRKFWEELRADLDVLQEELVYVRDHDLRALRGSIIAAAKVAATGLVNELAETLRKSAHRP